jgi:hypothetical protein
MRELAQNCNKNLVVAAAASDGQLDAFCLAQGVEVVNAVATPRSNGPLFIAC